jgi:hypothetical protein
MEVIWLAWQKYPIEGEMGIFWANLKRGENSGRAKFGKICIFAFIPIH